VGELVNPVLFGEANACNPWKHTVLAFIWQNILVKKFGGKKLALFRKNSQRRRLICCARRIGEET
jgi:hypothetical protein